MAKEKTVKKTAKQSSKQSTPKEVIHAESDIKNLDDIALEEAEEANLSLEESIDKLLEEKQEFVRSDAIEAKKQLDEFQSRNQDTSESSRPPKKSDIREIDGFSENVRILTEVFKRSSFDDYLALLSNPQRVFGMNILIGFFRGIGLSLGVGFVTAILYYLYRTQF